MKYDLPQKIAFVDLETTGSRITADRIIEVAIIRTENEKVVEEFQTLVNPLTYLPPFIQTMTNITDSDLEKAPTFSQIKKDVFDILEDCVFVAHNVRFDYSFLKHEFKREGITFTSRHFCTARLSKILFPQHVRHNLDSIINRFGFTCENRHRAYDDAKVLWDFFNALKISVSSETLGKAVHFALKKPSTPLHMSEADIEALPESCGVYIFYGEKDAPLYVGKSKNIKNRVKSHFTNDHLSTKEMKLSQQVRYIETIKTAGELGALITESILVKKLQPLFNRQLRVSQALVFLKKYQDENGYFRIHLETAKTVLKEEIESVVGVFKSKRQATTKLEELASDHNLCPKLLGLEKTNKACFSYQLKKCFGACIQKELPVKYNVRFLEAFGKIKISKWPFKGSVKIVEVDENEGLYEEFLVDTWCLLGSSSSQGKAETVASTELGTFDKDIYKLLLRYFRNPKNLNRAIPLPTR